MFLIRICLASTLVVCVYSLFPLSLFSQGEITYNMINDIQYYSEEDIETDYQRERCRLDLYYPANVDSFATVVWFHGGGLRAGEKFVPAQLQDQQIAVVAANYRLYPQVKNPVYMEDAAAAVAWTLDHIADYNGLEERVFVSGHSAGGYLTSMIGLDKSYLEKHGHNADRLAGLIPFSGHTITHFTLRDERGLGRTDVVVDGFAPLQHIRPDSPPYIIITGDRDLELLGRYEENAYMWRMMQEVNHPDCLIYELEGFNHGEMYGPACHILVKEIRRLIAGN